MKRTIKTLLVVIGSTIMAGKVAAQADPHFTQYYIYPSWTNPGLTGAFDGQYRIAGIYRTQWGNISSPYSTQGLSAEITSNHKMNYGISVLNQTAGDGGYRYTTGYLNLAYTGVRFGKDGNHRVSLGLQLGLIQRRFDATKLTFGDQWNPITGYNPGNPTTDYLKTNKANAFDAGAGFLYFDATPNKKANFYLGYSATHITRPKDDFSGNGKDPLPVRHTVHAGVRLKLSNTVSITPNFLYLRQGTAEEKTAALYARLRAGAETDVLVGANYRIKDAITPFVGFTHKRIVLGVSYDINTSDLGKLVKGSNSFEITLSYTGKRSVKTPEIEFVCPRL